MTRRIKTTAIFPPNGIYRQSPVPVEGYKPTENARFGVVRYGADAPWLLVHLATGYSVGNLLPALSRKITLTEKLAVAAARGAQTHLDWQEFDALPATTMETKEAPQFVLSPRDTLAAMRQIAEQVLA